MFYLTEYEDDTGVIKTRDFEADLSRARGYARRLSAKDHALLVYVVACTDADRVGAECYAYGRRDHADGRML